MKKNNFGFTLVEIIVVIGLLLIIALAGMGVNYNGKIDEEKVKDTKLKIQGALEYTRNNSLIGRSVTSSLVNPEKWIVNVSNANSGSIKVKYMSGGTTYPYSEYDLDLSGQVFSEISEVKCLGLDMISSGVLQPNKSMDIEFEGSKITFTGSDNPCTSSGKILKITNKYKTNTGVTLLNLVTGVIE